MSPEKSAFRCVSYVFLVFFLFATPGVQSWSFYNDQISAEEVALHTAQPNKTVSVVNNVHILDDSTFADFINSNPSVLVLFYAPWCHWCREFLPKYAEAATLLASQSLQVKLSQLDASKNVAASDLNEISAFPTIKFFLDGEPHQYDGGRRTTDVVKWVVAHLETEIIISSDQQLDALIMTNRDIPTLIAHFDKTSGVDPKSRQIFVSLSRKMDHIAFAEVEDSSVINRMIEHYQAPKEISHLKEFIVMVNPHVQKQPKFEPSTVLFPGRLDDTTALDLFIKTYIFPALILFDADIAPRAFKDGRPIWVLFTNGEDHQKSVLAIERTRELGKAHRHEMLFIHSDGQSVFDRRLQALLGIEHERFPTVRLFHSNPKGHSNWYSTLKYRPSAEVLESFNSEALQKFISDFQNDKLKPFVKSEPIPEENDDPVKILVADQFEELIQKSPRDVLVEFYAPWCGHCRKLEPVFNKVGQLLEPVKHVDVMKMDATLNEVNLMILGYPTLILFVRDHSGNEKKALYFTGERTTENLIKWVAEHSAQKFNADEILRPSISSSQQKAQERMQHGDAVDWMIDEL